MDCCTSNSCSCFNQSSNKWMLAWSVLNVIARWLYNVLRFYWSKNFAEHNSPLFLYHILYHTVSYAILYVIFYEYSSVFVFDIVNYLQLYRRLEDGSNANSKKIISVAFDVCIGGEAVLPYWCGFGIVSIFRFVLLLFCNWLTRNNNSSSVVNTWLYVMKAGQFHINEN